MVKAQDILAFVVYRLVSFFLYHRSFILSLKPTFYTVYFVVILFAWHYCKTLYFCYILISRFCNVEILLHFNLAFSECSTSIYQAFDGLTEFSGYVILQFYRTREISKNLMQAKNVLRYIAYTVLSVLTCR